MTEEIAKTDKKQTGEDRRSFFVVIQEVGHLLLITGLSVIATVRIGSSVEQVGGIARESVSSWGFLATFFAMTMFVLFILKSVRGTKLLGALFAFALLAGIAALASSFFGGAAGAVAFLVGAVVYYANPPVAAFDTILVFGLAGIASAVGFGFSPIALLVVMAVLAVYDVVAVYFTRHMVKLARVMLRRKVFFAMILPESPSGLKTRIANVNTESGFAFLGTGDLVLPALFAVSVTAAQGLFAAIPVVIGSVIGLLLTNILFLSQRFRRPMPALPPIVLGAIAGYATNLFIISV